MRKRYTVEILHTRSKTPFNLSIIKKHRADSIRIEFTLYTDFSVMITL